MSQLSELKGTYVLDPNHSRIGFIARHAMVTKVRGSFNEFSGTATIDGENPSALALQVEIKTASIDTRNADRDGHLRSGDFLQTEAFPEITFVATSAVIVNEQEVVVTGDLTIKGTTKSVTIPFTFDGEATDPFGNVRIGFEGSTSINRSDFGITWNAVLEAGGVLVSDRIELEFEVSAIKQG